MSDLAEPVAFDAYRGVLLNHVEMLYQPGDRGLATWFFELLGWEVRDSGAESDVGDTYLYVHLEPSEPDRLNNIFYLSERRPEQADLEEELHLAMRERPGLARALAAFRTKARTAPHGIPHLGVRYATFEQVEAAVDALARCPDPALTDRVSVDVVRPGDPRSMTDELIQAFVHTDIVGSGLFLTGQLFELQAQRRQPAIP